MALLGQSGMTFNQGLRCSDSVGGCISYGEAPVGTDTDFTDVTYTLLMRAKKINSGTTVGRCSVGFSDNIGTDKRTWMEVEANVPSTSQMQVRCKIHGFFSGVVTKHTYNMTKDTNEHSFVWTHNPVGSSVLYVDGAPVDTQAGLNEPFPPAAGTDKFTVWGSHSPGVEMFYADCVAYSTDALSAAQVLSYHNNGLPGDT